MFNLTNNLKFTQTAIQKNSRLVGGERLRDYNDNIPTLERNLIFILNFPTSQTWSVFISKWLSEIILTHISSNWF